MPIKRLSQSGLLTFEKYSSMLAGNSAYIPVATGYEHLETQTLSNSNTSVVTFSNLNSTYGSTYQHLAFRIRARGADSNTGSGVLLRMYMNGIGGDGGGSDYATHLMRFVNNGTFGSEGYADAPYMFTGFATAQFGDYAVMLIDLLDPFETTKFKTVRSLGGVAETGGVNNLRGSNIALLSGVFKRTNAVTSVSFQFNAGWIFQEGSRFSMYGLRSA